MIRSMSMFLAAAFLITFVAVSTAVSKDSMPKEPTECAVTVSDGKISIRAGILERTIRIDGVNVSTTGLRVKGAELLAEPAKEFAVTFRHASVNRKPRGLTPEMAGKEIDFQKVRNIEFIERTELLDAIPPGQEAKPGAARWVEPITVEGARWANVFDVITHLVSKPRPGVTRLNIRARSTKEGTLGGVSVDLFYEVYDGYSAIRKWVEIGNNGLNWLILDQLVIDDIVVADNYRHRTPLAPGGSGITPSVVSFGNKVNSRGVIAGNEIPSALRIIHDSGAQGYTDKHFEWVLGPSERFISEPVFLYAYDGTVRKTASRDSTPLDRTVEGPYMQFLREHLGIAWDTANIPAPLWCSWANLGDELSDTIIREQADIAAEAGFACLQMDAGWMRGSFCKSARPDTDKFPDFDATCAYVRSKGLKLGLWVSCYRDLQSLDLKALPGSQSLPLIRRGWHKGDKGGLAMSWASPWRDYYANDLVYLHERYGATYFKQDFSNIMFGDIAEGHDSRTKRESVLRGLRGLLAAQDTVRHLTPDVVTQITHEVYWNTPGCPADLAVLKHVPMYHIPPNYSRNCGGGVSGRPAGESWDYDHNKLHKQVISSSHFVRRQFYSHRGLPMYCFEFYGAGAVNFRNTQVQDRQVCSWLMGTPMVFTGDLRALEAGDIARYRELFGIIATLQKKYDFYRYFQFSGVPEPTDSDWHWWGKLNPDGCGAVVVLRGNGGEPRRAINIPWVADDRTYRVTRLLDGKQLGNFAGRQLQHGAVKMALPVYGQEILELAPVR